ncbi:hypothetical protein NFX46_40145 (plasmid) [Streptomyces phaeoluteigriseus]|uniref:Uncharacterized protein n=1 Tax=Streptomyces phaeoluteigriseus TaxID=114686 RepID=A0ABY4ZNI4_9ACTN|nr:hypothetical protein [Streptomyces phaeoluteigriseus]USQ89898.1 hypothetical protein NFX46_40145 [Streptomyces phaeoluteigriseus]
MNASTLPSLLPGLAAAGTALADAPWWITVVFLLPALPALASGTATLITARSDARTRAMWDRHEDTYLTDPDRYRAGLDHIARVRQSLAVQPSVPAPDPAAQSQPPAEPSPAPP